MGGVWGGSKMSLGRSGREWLGWRQVRSKGSHMESGGGCKGLRVGTWILGVVGGLG